MKKGFLLLTFLFLQGPSLARAQIPLKYQGTWIDASYNGDNNSVCKSNDMEPSRIKITQNSLEYYEMWCDVLNFQVRKSKYDKEDQVKTRLSCREEGTAETRQDLWSIQTVKNQKVLVILTQWESDMRNKLKRRSNYIEEYTMISLFTNCE